MNLKIIIILLLTLTSVSAATLQGSIYNTNLDIETDVLVEIDTQQYLSKDGTYQFDIKPGEYQLTARKSFITITEEITIKEGNNIFDLFLLPDFTDEDELWTDTQASFFEEDLKDYEWWRYLIGALIILYAFFRFGKERKRFGSLNKFKKRIKEDGKKSLSQHKEELSKEPGYLDQALEIIKNNDGRLSQKQLRREMLYLSEAKVSLIVTELEHRGQVEKVKKGRGNVLILKE